MPTRLRVLFPGPLTEAAMQWIDHYLLSKSLCMPHNQLYGYLLVHSLEGWSTQRRRLTWSYLPNSRVTEGRVVSCRYRSGSWNSDGYSDALLLYPRRPMNVHLAERRASMQPHPSRVFGRCRHPKDAGRSQILSIGRDTYNRALASGPNAHSPDR